MSRALFVLLLSSVITAACGGGGQSHPSPQSQSISFTKPGTLYKFIGDVPFSNVAAGGVGMGSITYASDTTTVASVDPRTGTVTINGIGSAVITANKAADANYIATQASYVLRVGPRTVAVTAWVGATDTEVSFDAQAASLDFTRSSDLACDPSLYTVCGNGVQSALVNTNLVDTTSTFQQTAMYWLKHGSNVTNGIVVPELKFGRMLNGSAVPFAGRLWLTASNLSGLSEIWSTVDGSNWQFESAQVPLTPSSQLLVFNDALWVIGGADKTENPSEVWKSIDGKNWAAVPQGASFPTRGYFGVTAFNGRLWITGGSRGTTNFHDVWSSVDGSNWIQATSAAAFPARGQHKMLTFGGRMWVIGGFSGSADADVWSSTDGVTWTQETDTADFGPRFAQSMAVADSRMWLIGGRNAYESAQRDVWTSTDGKAWSLVTDDAPFILRSDAAMAVWNGKLWLIGGGGNEVWSSVSGTNWSKVSLSAVVPGESAVASVAFKGRIWVLGDEYQLWSSADGLSWNEEVHQMPSFNGSSDSRLLVLGDQLIFIGIMQYSAPNYFREVWGSADGKIWSKLSAEPFLAQGLNDVVEFNGKLWAFAGNSTDAYAAEIWSSSDAKNWVQIVAPAPFSPRANYRILAYSNKLWAIGGNDSSNVGKNDIWSSADGLTWTPIGSNTGLPASVFGSGIALADKMCVYRAVAPYGADAWCSSGGTTWEKKSDNVPFGPIALLDGTVFAVGSAAAPFATTDLVWKSVDGVAWRIGYKNVIIFP